MKKNHVIGWVRGIVIVLIVCLGLAANAAYTNYTSSVTDAQSAMQASQLSGEALLKATGDISLMVMVFFLWAIIEVSIFVHRYFYEEEPRMTKSGQNVL